MWYIHWKWTKIMLSLGISKLNYQFLPLSGEKNGHHTEMAKLENYKNYKNVFWGQNLKIWPSMYPSLTSIANIDMMTFTWHCVIEKFSSNSLLQIRGKGKKGTTQHWKTYFYWLGKVTRKWQSGKSLQMRKRLLQLLGLLL